MAKKPLGSQLIQEQQQIEAPASQLVIPYQFSGISKSETIPSVKNLTRLKFQNLGLINVVDFKNGQEGQEIKLLGDGFTNLVFDILKLITNTGSDKPLVLNSVYTFIRFDNKWIEDSCCGGSSRKGIDGGFPDSIYGGTSPIEGGAP